MAPEMSGFFNWLPLFFKIFVWKILFFFRDLFNIKKYSIWFIFKGLFRTNFMVLGLDDIKIVDMTFIKAAYVKYHITGIWDMNHVIWFIWHTNSIICSINKGSLASRIEYAEHILSRFRPIQLLLPVQSPTTVHLPTVPTACFVSENVSLKTP